MNNPGTFTELSPQQLLRQVTNCSDSTCLQAFSNSVFWSIYINQGKIVYATHSVEPFDRLERHLRRLRPNSLLLTSEIRGELRLLFDPDCQTQLRERPDNSLTRLPEYQAINWLINEQLLVSTQVARLVQAVSQEVIESFLLIKQGTYEFKELGNDIDIICQLDTDNVLEYCQNRLQIWQSFTPEITSPYQRPYLLINSKFYHQQLPELQENLTSWMKGFSLRHLAVIMDQDELELAQTLYPHTLRGTIILHESDPPYDKLPKILTNSPAAPQYITGVVTDENISPQSSLLEESFQHPIISSNTKANGDTVSTATINSQSNYKILSVDDSPTILKEISRFLEAEKFSVVTVNEPVKAVMSIIRHKPDLILLDLNMAGIDGYELCRIIRNNSLFKTVPIIFVTGNKGIVDKVKAKIVGASGYLTKPFTRTELMKMIFMHLA